MNPILFVSSKVLERGNTGQQSNHSELPRIQAYYWGLWRGRPRIQDSILETTQISIVRPLLKPWLRLVLC